MSTRHTPGPWTVQRYTNYEGFSIWAPGVGCVAERWAPTQENVPFEANARLIAAAPDLLAALKQMCAEFRDYDLPYGSPAYLAANEAILKAEGAQ